MDAVRRSCSRCSSSYNSITISQSAAATATAVTFTTKGTFLLHWQVSIFYFSSHSRWSFIYWFILLLQSGNILSIVVMFLHADSQTINSCCSFCLQILFQTTKQSAFKKFLNPINFPLCISCSAKLRNDTKWRQPNRLVFLNFLPECRRRAAILARFSIFKTSLRKLPRPNVISVKDIISAVFFPLLSITVSFYPRRRLNPHRNVDVETSERAPSVPVTRSSLPSLLQAF